MYAVFIIHVPLLYSSLFTGNLKKGKYLWMNNIPLSCLCVPQALDKYKQNLT